MVLQTGPKKRLRISTARSRRLRMRQTVSEMLLWRELRSRKLQGFKFRRQVAIGPFIADFYCAEAMLIIELDGSIHQESAVEQYDRNREKYLRNHGFYIFRCTNDEVNDSMDKLLSDISARCALSRGRPSPLSPLPLRKERGTF